LNLIQVMLAEGVKILPFYLSDAPASP